MTTATGEAAALVSLFGSLNFGVALGNVEGMSDATVVTFIDPLADSPPDDTKIVREPSVLVTLTKPDPMQAHLESIIRDGIGQKALQQLMQKIEEWKFRKDLGPILVRLNDTRALPPKERSETLAAVIQEQVNRIYRLMRYIADEFAEKQKGHSPVDRLIPHMNAMVKLESDGKTPTAELNRGMVAACNAVLHELESKLAAGDVDMEYLWLLFSGGAGAALVGKQMFSLATDLELPRG